MHYRILLLWKLFIRIFKFKNLRNGVSALTPQHLNSFVLCIVSLNNMRHVRQAIYLIFGSNHLVLSKWYPSLFLYGFSYKFVSFNSTILSDLITITLFDSRKFCFFLCLNFRLFRNLSKYLNDHLRNHLISKLIPEIKESYRKN